MSAFIPPEGAVKFHCTNPKARGLMWVMPEKRAGYANKCRHKIIYRPLFVIRGFKLLRQVNEFPGRCVCLCDGELVKGKP